MVTNGLVTIALLQANGSVGDHHQAGITARITDATSGAILVQGVTDAGGRVSFLLPIVAQGYKVTMVNLGNLQLASATPQNPGSWDQNFQVTASPLGTVVSYLTH